MSNDGGSKNIETVKNSAVQLKNLQFSADEIVKMVSHHGGSNNLKYVCDNFTQLEEHGFNKEEVIKHLNFNSGYLKLRELLNAKKDTIEKNDNRLGDSVVDNTNTLFNSDNDSVNGLIAVVKAEVSTPPMSNFSIDNKRKRESVNSNNYAKRLRLTL